MPTELRLPQRLPPCTTTAQLSGRCGHRCLTNAEVGVKEATELCKARELVLMEVGEKALEVMTGRVQPRHLLRSSLRLT